MCIWASHNPSPDAHTYHSHYLPLYPLQHQKAKDSDHLQQLADVLRVVPVKVNRTDAATLLNTFGSVAAIVSASAQDLALCPGIGLKKAKAIYSAFRDPILY